MIFKKSKQTNRTFILNFMNVAHPPIYFQSVGSSQNEKLNILAKVRFLLIFPKPFTQFFIPFPKCDGMMV
jgi:hypothetical protein